MKTYTWKTQWHFGTKENQEISEIREKLKKHFISGVFSVTIPELAKGLKTEEQKVAWALQDLCYCVTPDIIINSDEGEAYFKRVVKLMHESPRPFTDAMKFYSKLNR